MARIANCPNCGGQVEFKAGTSLLAVCGYCQSCVARVGDDITDLEILGKVAPLAALASPLYVGLSGRYERRPFTIVGRVQLDYGRGPWNEWYAAFDDGAWGWVAEAQGRVYVTFPKVIGDLPPYSAWRTGARFTVGNLKMTVTERRKARFVSGEGELPFRVEPGAEFKYCDLEGDNDSFGTLDFGTGDTVETVFLGKQLEYTDLFAAGDLHGTTQPEAPAAVGLNCPNCGAAVELRAPDETERVTCPACESLLDAQKGSTLFLLSSAKRGGLTPKLELGLTGKYKGERWTIHGHLTRGVVVDGITYYWEEYLLRGEKRGYRWLTVSNDHWSWIEPVGAGRVEIRPLRSATVGDKTFRHFQTATARVESIRGEFYWKVEQGESAGVSDFVAPPLVLSEEQSAEETTYSIGTYLTPAEVQQIFALKKPLPRPTGVAPNQPNPHGPGARVMALAALAFTGAAIFLGVTMSGKAEERVVYSDSHPLSAETRRTGAAVEADVVLSPAFSLTETSNVEIAVQANVLNSWFYLAGALIEQASGEVRTFGAEISYYKGYTSGESWSEGGTDRTLYLGSVPAGEYVLRLEPQVDREGYKLSGAQGLNFATMYNVRVRTDVFMTSHLVFLLLFLWVWPVVQVLRRQTFEGRRWAESDHAGGSE